MFQITDKLTKQDAGEFTAPEPEGKPAAPVNLVVSLSNHDLGTQVFNLLTSMNSVYAAAINQAAEREHR